MEEKKQKNFLMRLLCGYGIGFAFIVPGISGSAMAMLFGIYEDMIASVSNVFKQFKKSVLFLIPIAIGVGLAVASMIVPITWALEKSLFVTIMLFAGFIIGGLKPMLKKVKWNKVPSWVYIFFICAFLIVIGLSCLTFIPGTEADLMGSDIATKQYPMMIIVGVIFALSMVLPGVSGATLLISIGYYSPIFDLAKQMIKDLVHFEFVWQSYLLLILLVIGMLVGAIVLSKLLTKSFEKYPEPTYMGVCGFAIGSIPAMFISQEWGLAKMSTPHIIGGILTLILGIAISYTFVYLQERQEKKNQLNPPLTSEEQN